MAGPWCEICHKDVGGFFGSAYKCSLCHRLVCKNCQIGNICKLCRAKMDGKDKKR